MHQVGRETPLLALGLRIKYGETRVYNMVPLPSWPSPHEV
jgi:hypothetical protein